MTTTSGNTKEKLKSPIPQTVLIADGKPSIGVGINVGNEQHSREGTPTERTFRMRARHPIGAGFVKEVEARASASRVREDTRRRCAQGLEADGALGVVICHRRITIIHI